MHKTLTDYCPKCFCRKYIGRSAALQQLGLYWRICYEPPNPLKFPATKDLCYTVLMVTLKIDSLPQVSKLLKFLNIGALESFWLYSIIRALDSYKVLEAAIDLHKIRTT